MEETENADLIILGAGAAGVFSAIHAAESNPGIRILVLEKSAQILAKVRISGGGRCNLTNALEPRDAFLQQYPRGRAHMQHLLYRFGPQETMKWFENNGVALKTEPDLRVFPKSNNSESIVNCLKDALRKKGISLRLSFHAKSISPVENGFSIVSDYEKLHARALILAVGGLPQLSSYHWMHSLGLKIQMPVPSLFTFNVAQHPAAHLMGLSAVCRIRIEGTHLEESGPLLITHWGFSGPAVLRCSAWGARELEERNYRFTIRIHWLPTLQQDEIREHLTGLRGTMATKRVYQRVFHEIPGRLWEYLCQRSGILPTQNWADLSRQNMNRLVESISADTYTISGKTTFKEEFVTCGGIALNEIQSQTCMAKKHPGLFLAGEILDVDGITGGFNLQHAWSSGYVAGCAAANYLG